MKKTHLAGAMSLLLLATAAQAAPLSTELKVGGELSPKGACTVQLGSGGIVDLGKIKAGSVGDELETPLQASQVAFHISCEKETRVTYTIADNKQGSESKPGQNNFGFGNVNGSGKLGYYTIKAIQGTVDNSITMLFNSMNNNGQAPVSMPMMTLEKEKYHGWLAPGSNVRVASGKDYKINFWIQPMMGSKKDMNGPLTEDTALDGSATINLFYSI
ncbi:DUF1120 domain-containing protein [Serratia liquefaciens]|uniref:DUF1120 domain-containing protein n=1 Tax=Serratia liquefaciens TaxID=614 RepID=UPI002360D9C7|nr:DUF1120 domain-containing protein [Serratia liquefaciens]